MAREEPESMLMRMYASRSSAREVKGMGPSDRGTPEDSSLVSQVARQRFNANSTEFAASVDASVCLTGRFSACCKSHMC